MFYYLEGKVAHVEPYLAVIDCGGVGYACRTTNHTIRQLKKGEVKRLYTYLNVGDGIFELYGFATEQELNSFKLLIGVSGVGRRGARGARLHAAGHFRGAQGRGRGDSAARGDRAPEPEKNGEVKKVNAE